MSPRVQLLSAIGLAVAVILTAVLVMRQELLTAVGDSATRQQEALDTAARKLGALDSRISALEAQPKPDIASVETLRDEVKAARETIAAHESTLSSLNEKVSAPPAPVAPVAGQDAETTILVALAKSGVPYSSAWSSWEKTHPERSATVPRLRAHAASGIPTEAALREQFRELVARLDAPQPGNEPKLIQRINTHLAGLVSVKKANQAPSDYELLRRLDPAAPLSSIATRVDALAPIAQAPFALWREAVRDREAALAELVTLTGTEATP